MHAHWSSWNICKIYMNTCMRVCMYERMYVCICVCVYIYIYISICKDMHAWSTSVHTSVNI